MLLIMEEVKKIVAEELEALKQRIIDNHIAEGQKASGRTIQSLNVVMRENGGTLFGRQAFGTLEHGRKAGATPKGFVGIIKQWIKDKGLTVPSIPYIRQPSEKWQPKYKPEERGLNSLAGAIAHRIKTEGTRLFRDGGRDDIYTPEIEIATENINQRISVLLQAEIRSINDELIDYERNN